MPKYLPHIVTTPPSPGHSVHLAFAICRDRPNRVPGNHRPPTETVVWPLPLDTT